MLKIRSLQQRLVLFLLLPVAALLLGMGIIGFIYARNSLLSQWREAAILKLQRAARDGRYAIPYFHGCCLDITSTMAAISDIFKDCLVVDIFALS